MRSKYQVRISEKIIANKNRCSFTKKATPEIVEIIKGIASSPRFVGDGVASKLYEPMVTNLEKLIVEDIGSFEWSLPIQSFWFEYIVDKPSQAHILPPKAGVFVKHVVKEEGAFIEGHVVISTMVPINENSKELTLGFIFDPFRIIIPIGDNGIVSSYNTRSLIDDNEIELVSISELVHSSMRVLSLALYSVKMVIEGTVQGMVLEPPAKLAKVMEKSSPIQALLLPHIIINAKGWKP
jgi:hypothetical protein